MPIGPLESRVYRVLEEPAGEMVVGSELLEDYAQQLYNEGNRKEEKRLMALVGRVRLEQGVGLVTMVVGVMSGIVFFGLGWDTGKEHLRLLVESAGIGGGGLVLGRGLIALAERKADRVMQRIVTARVLDGRNRSADR